MTQVLDLTLETLDQAVRGHDLLVVALGGNAVHLAGLQLPEGRVQFARAAPASAAAIAALVGLQPDQPGLIIFGQQVILYCEPGEHSPAAVDAVLERVCALDLDLVRAEIETQKQAELALRMRRVCPTARRGHVSPGNADEMPDG